MWLYQVNRIDSKSSWNMKQKEWNVKILKSENTDNQKKGVLIKTNGLIRNLNVSLFCPSPYCFLQNYWGKI